ncbi:MAG: hypothetical protein A3J38_08125 [Gammaproteobacteria bacterium RIFCSPHIGHO2_12_FULL_45_9]|nr:MAG: hypothetical protein A3J38_08125 [Gammaproteobacteria bacterium RIFCSPHIGHO2_12_FULL_45_9]
MKPIFFAYPGNETLTQSLAEAVQGVCGQWEIHTFPDEESLVRLTTDVSGATVFFVASLDRPNAKLIPLVFAAETARFLGAKGVHIIAPYLAYMRQDDIFHAGEGMTMQYCASLLSRYFDSLMTVDPHLHRCPELSNVYTIPATAVHAAPLIAAWIKQYIEKPVLLGPDRESSQWASQIADLIQVPAFIMEKTRLGDREIKTAALDCSSYRGHHAVIVDDMISTGVTMRNAVLQLKKQGVEQVSCIAVHGIFADDAYTELLNAGVTHMVTCNTIPHVSNGIDIASLIVPQLVAVL